jgi:hypothetical protein
MTAEKEERKAIGKLEQRRKLLQTVNRYSKTVIAGEQLSIPAVLYGM